MEGESGKLRADFLPLFILGFNYWAGSVARLQTIWCTRTTDCSKTPSERLRPPMVRFVVRCRTMEEEKKNKIEPMEFEPKSHSACCLCLEMNKVDFGRHSTALA